MDVVPHWLVSLSEAERAISSKYRNLPHWDIRLVICGFALEIQVFPFRHEH